MASRWQCQTCYYPNSLDVQYEYALVTKIIIPEKIVDTR